MNKQSIANTKSRKQKTIQHQYNINTTQIPKRYKANTTPIQHNSQSIRKQSKHSAKSMLTLQNQYINTTSTNAKKTIQPQYNTHTKQ